MRSARYDMWCGCVSVMFDPPPPAVVRAGGSVDFPYGGGMVMGVRSPLRTKAVSVPLHVGDRLFLYTDGLPETRNEKGAMMGFDGGLVEMFA
ncbi:MAG TPA: SpoIIE family protein phosphatase, partial [Spirochaetota bacterium]|nr:SpoIIE family protein phosphatase [Spirochaetota bacterium]